MARRRLKVGMWVRAIPYKRYHKWYSPAEGQITNVGEYEVTLFSPYYGTTSTHNLRRFRFIPLAGNVIVTEEEGNS